MRLQKQAMFSILQHIWQSLHYFIDSFCTALMIVCKSKPSAARVWGEKEQKSDWQVSLCKAQQDPLCNDLATGQQLFLLFKFVVDTGQ